MTGRFRYRERSILQKNKSWKILWLKGLFPSYLLEAICQTIAATEEGLSNREIGKILADSRIEDIDDGSGFPFHDRFLLFPGSAKDGLEPEAYFLGTSVNSVGRQYHIVAAIEHPQEIIDKFNHQWGSLQDTKCLVFKHP